MNDAAKVAVGVNVNAAKPEFNFSGLSNEELAQRAEQQQSRRFYEIKWNLVGKG